VRFTINTIKVCSFEQYFFFMEIRRGGGHYDIRSSGRVVFSHPKSGFMRLTNVKSL